MKKKLKKDAVRAGKHAIDIIFRNKRSTDKITKEDMLKVFMLGVKYHEELGFTTTVSSPEKNECDQVWQSSISAFMGDQFCEDQNYRIQIIPEEKPKPKKVKPASTRPPGLYSTLRDMNIGEKMCIDISKWGPARTAASQLKRVFGCLYTVYHRKNSPEDKSVEITRYL